MRSGVWNALRWVPCKYQEFQKSIMFLRSGNRISVAEFLFSNIINFRNTLRFWDLVYGMLFAGSISNLMNFKKHYVFEFWCKGTGDRGQGYKAIFLYKVLPLYNICWHMFSWKWCSRLHDSTIFMFDCGHTILIMMLSPARGYMFNICKLHDYNHKSLTTHRNPLLWTGIPYCRRKPLTPMLYKQTLYYRMTSPAIERNPLL